MFPTPRKGSLLKAERNPEVDQMEWTTTGYTNPVRKTE
jgi:hypothetical protein